ncbi:2-hydroxy-3-keto-5-methylthiopentenyl-1-phosphate phosphatase [Bacillus alkalicellulosilyticus]|uniref:2-hydroxy-3-keto-5-methylthiopentenyl-1- phosphate phosphatase n=1 Tax=Alkalihalobacterium alkalicellulosilyticum TaxID=1912214 RepID=UPI000995F5F9|nr:2-hydroxy-3-keto-5-methylthiopentenyl-1-phosphate phosphatase [Bacillus alkalicellulosilyticus]
MQQPLHFGDQVNKDYVIFCDFDGTVTNNDNIVEIMKMFAPKEWEIIAMKILSKEKSIRKGVNELFALLPTSKKDEIISFTLEQAEFREGFDEFVAYTHRHNVELNIVSGGIDFFIDPLLQSYQIPIYCNTSDFSDDVIKIGWPYRCDDDCQNDCGCCKPSIIRKVANGRQVVVIGDSITDVQAAKQADFVFARDYLLKECQQLDLPHAPFTTFFDIINVLKTREVNL